MVVQNDILCDRRKALLYISNVYRSEVYCTTAARAIITRSLTITHLMRDSETDRTRCFFLVITWVNGIYLSIIQYNWVQWL
jgi:hypothetical protein